jgi:hypothetical protein
VKNSTEQKLFFDPFNSGSHNDPFNITDFDNPAGRRGLKSNPSANRKTLRL